ncbi:MAG TPA: ABC transporter substrate-binding protein, partial [Acidimicrobiales bacterium]|nr:ABC transporter substrate-binding protein [Acidimicrobiales bacterium]
NYLQSSSALPPGVTPAPAPGSSGTTKGGVKCAPGVRQIPWSAYAPECVPSWTGNNGGATAPGVTKSTITIVYREFASANLSFLYSLIPKTIIGTNQEAENTLNADVKVFNRYFELYGRHVVVKAFSGQGDLLNEMTGGGQAQAEADAITAKSLGAFADMSFADTSQFYTEAVANQHIIAFPLLFLEDQDAYKQGEPYLYSTGPDCTKTNTAIAAMASNSMAGLPAIYSGDPSLQTKTRSFGIVYVDNPYATNCEQGLVADLKDRGVTPAKIASYNFSPSSMPAQISTIIEQMKSAGVTTILYPDEDPVTPGLFMNQAHGDGYHPEWVLVPSFSGGNIDADALNRHFASEAPDEMAHAIVPGIVSGPAKSQEDYKTFEMGMPGADPLPTYSLGWSYGPTMLFFSALQAAGPDLTAATFEQAFHKLTASAPGGMLGQWQFGPNVYDPASSFQLLWWSNTSTSNQDGLQGAMQACNGGKQYTYANVDQQLPSHQQLKCFGSS